jgi:hypothetical protein
MCALVVVVAALSLLAAVLGWGPRSASAGAEGPPELGVNINDDCIEGDGWPSRVEVSVKVRDSGGTVVYATTASTNSAGYFHVDDPGYVRGDCSLAPDLRPGMKVTASHGGTTKVLILERVTFDQLDPLTDTASGTAALGPAPEEPCVRFEVFLFSNDGGPGVEAAPQVSPNGDWFVDFGALGGKVEVGSFGDVTLRDSDCDSTTADRFVTAVSLSASVPAGAASLAGARGAGAPVVERGARVRLSGRLSAGTAACTKKKRVTLLKVAGKRSKAVRSRRTNRSGRYSFTRKMNRTTSFRVRYRGNRKCQRSKSRVRAVRVARR